MPPPGNEYAAEQLKNSGNKCFKNGDYEEAEGLYSQAIQKNSNNPLYQPRECAPEAGEMGGCY
jgi:tetratricopeptide (TPR) repeat protein